MKFIKFLSVSAAVALFSFSALADSTAPLIPPTFIEELRGILVQCTQPLNSGGEQASGLYQVLCPDQVRIHPAGASHGVKVLMDGEVYLITTRPSPDSDGGDLTDIRIQDSYGRNVLVMRNVLSYGDPILGIVGERQQ
jgi:hypothetical protein